MLHVYLFCIFIQFGPSLPAYGCAMSINNWLHASCLPVQGAKIVIFYGLRKYNPISTKKQLVPLYILRRQKNENIAKNALFFTNLSGISLSGYLNNSQQQQIEYFAAVYYYTECQPLAHKQLRFSAYFTPSRSIRASMVGSPPRKRL